MEVKDEVGRWVEVSLPSSCGTVEIELIPSGYCVQTGGAREEFK